MKPVRQTNTMLPGGNCFQACVASIFDMSLDSVPAFMKGSTGGIWEQRRWDAVRKFAKEHGTYAFHLDPDIDSDKEHIQELHRSQLYYIATGPSLYHPEFGHCVVMHKGKYVHDPMGDSKFLGGDPWLFIGFAPNEDSL